jgi:hypothetical protein
MWDNSDTPNDSFATRPAQVVVKGLSFKEPVWVDLVSGRIYEIPRDRLVNAGDFTIFKDLPLYDSPVLVTEKDLVAR